jgi:autotransporter-associated beta strand protein
VLFDDNAANSTVNVTETVSPAAALFDNSTRNYILTGPGAVAGSGALTKNGAGALTINNANTYSGGTVLNAGTLNINNASAIGTGPLAVAAGTTINNTSGSPVTLSTNNAQVWDGNFTFGGASALNMGTGPVTLTDNRTLTVNGAGALTVGPIAESGGPRRLTKAGPGTLVLSGNSTYTGGTTVNAGTLSVNAALAGGVTVAAGARLAGSGTITGAIDVSGNLSSGNDTNPANLRAGSARLRGGSTLGLDLAGPANYDTLSLTGALAIDPGSTLSVTFSGGFSPAAGQSFDVMTFASKSGRFSSYTGLQLTGGLTLAPFYLGHALRLIATLPGDATGDGSVNFDDFQRLELGFAQPVGWQDGDFNLDGFVDFLDFASLREHFGQSVPGATPPPPASRVPEPGTLCIFAIALALIRRQARCK